MYFTQKNICNFGCSKTKPSLHKNTILALRNNSYKILFFLSFTVLINTFGFSQELPKKSKIITPVKTSDTVNVVVDSLSKLPINLKESDTTKTDSIPKKKGLLEDIVKYKATDRVSMNQKEQKIYLYNEAEVYYQDLEITSGIIVIDYTTNTVYAGRIKDSTGYSQAPVFKQGNNVIEPDSIIFNTKTQKAVVFNSKTEQSGGTIISEITKKENDSVFFIKEGKFTTSENLDDPEYYFRMRKAKLVPNKKVITGLTNMYIYDVPTPIGLPFAFFPMSKKQTSGVIFPSFGQDTGNNRGYFLQNGGYYFAISDFIDLAVLGDYYTNGSYGLRFESNYAFRYKYRGNVSFRFENLLNSERGFSDFSQNTIYNLRWSHSQDQKSNPSSRFSASVNLGSSQFFRQSINQANVASFQNNTLASSVSYSKTFQGEPQVNLSLTATHSQNTNTERIDMTLPTMQASVTRMYPFAPKEGAKKGIIHNINFQYNVRGENRIQTTDSLFFKPEMFDDARVGMRHSIPITTNFKVFKHFSMSASTNFEETWTLNTIDRFFDTATQQVVTRDLNGFDSFRTYNFSAGIGTTIYGMFDFTKNNKDAKIQAIRHVMRPEITYSINPAFDQYFEEIVISADGLTTAEFSRFEGSLFGAPNNRFSSSIGLSLGNNFEAKVRDKDSTKTEPKKIVLLNNLNFSTSYDLAADSLNLAPVRVTGGMQILNKKMNINFGMVLDPYALDNNNQKVDIFNIDNGGSLFRLTSANVNMSYSLSSKDFSGEEQPDKNKGLEDNLRNGGRADDLFGVSEDFANRRLNDEEGEKEKEKSEFYNYSMPWSMRLAYAVNYNNNRRENQIASHSLMFSGDVDLSPRWAVGFSSGYDFLNNDFTFTQIRFERDLLSWRMNFSWVPIGTRTSWNFFIGIKSSILKDLKYDQRRQPDIRF